MIGAIRTWDVLCHPIITIEAFGWRVFYRAVFDSSGRTFLSLLERLDDIAAQPSNEPELIERCIRLELQAKQIYESLARRFADSPQLRAFLLELAQQEQEHADLLRVCRATVFSTRRNVYRFSPWHDYVPVLEQQMQQVIASLDQVCTVEDVGRLVIQAETSEVNQVFLGVIRDTNSRFVQNLAPFRDAVRDHFRYFCEEIPRLAPRLSGQCGEVLAKCE